MRKYYRVKQDTFLWKAGAILSDQEKGQYVPIEDIWNVAEKPNAEYISAPIIEHPDNAVFFERVYPDSIAGKIYHTKDQLLEAYKGAFK